MKTLEIGRRGTNETSSAKDREHRRSPWQTPSLRVLPARAAEVGLDILTDGDFTAS